MPKGQKLSNQRNIVFFFMPPIATTYQQIKKKKPLCAKTFRCASYAQKMQSNTLERHEQKQLT